MRNQCKLKPSRLAVLRLVRNSLKHTEDSHYAGEKVKGSDVILEHSLRF